MVTATSIAPREAYPLGPVLGFLGEVWALNHALELSSKRTQSRLGITGQQRVLLRIVGRHPLISAGHLARLLHVDAGTVSAAVRRLEARGLLERRADKRDKRRTLLALTAAGRKLDTPAPGTAESAVQDVLEHTPESDTQAIRAFLERLVEALDPPAGDRAARGVQPKHDELRRS